MVREANITQEQVNAVADALRGGGIKPTVRAVRDKLGTGSNATVMRLLENWKAGQIKVADAPVTLPTPLQRALVDYLAQAVAEQKAELGSELAEQKQVNADLAVENERQSEEIDNLQSELEAMRTERDSLMGRLVQLDADLRLARAEAEQERGIAATVRTDLAKAQLRLEALPRLETDLQQARSDLVQERESRAAAEQAAAVAVARKEGETKARERVEAELASAVARGEKAAEAIKAGGDQVRDLTAQLATEKLGRVRAEKDLQTAKEQLGENRRARMASGLRRLKEKPTDGGAGKPKK